MTLNRANIAYIEKLEIMSNLQSIYLSIYLCVCMRVHIDLFMCVVRECTCVYISTYVYVKIQLHQYPHLIIIFVSHEFF